MPQDPLWNGGQTQRKKTGKRVYFGLLLFLPGVKLRRLEAELEEAVLGGLHCGAEQDFPRKEELPQE